MQPVTHALLSIFEETFLAKLFCSLKAICHFSHIFFAARGSPRHTSCFVCAPKSAINEQQTSYTDIYSSTRRPLALLPPTHRWVRPRTAPPPPPTAKSAGSRSPKSPKHPSRATERVEKGKEVKNAAKPTCFYENAEFYNQLPAESYIKTTPQQMAPRKTGTVNCSNVVVVNLV